MEIDDIYGYDFEIIDIRDKNEFNESHLDNARNVSLNNIIINPSVYLKKDRNYLLICEYGIQSRIVMKILNRLGYHTYTLKDGYRGLISKRKVQK